MKPTKMFVFTRQIMENLVSKPVTEEYPFKQSNYTERMRGHIEIDIEQCISCTLCAQNCPPGAIQVDRQKGTWSIDRFDCVQCGNCINVCPKKCLHMKKRVYYAGYPKEYRNICTPCKKTTISTGKRRLCLLWFMCQEMS